MRETKIVIVFIGLNWRSWYKSCTKKSIKNRHFYKKKIPHKYCKKSIC